MVLRRDILLFVTAQQWPGFGRNCRSVRTRTQPRSANEWNCEKLTPSQLNYELFGALGLTGALAWRRGWDVLFLMTFLGGGQVAWEEGGTFLAKERP